MKILKKILELITLIPCIAFGAIYFGAYVFIFVAPVYVILFVVSAAILRLASYLMREYLDVYLFSDKTYEHNMTVVISVFLLAVILISYLYWTKVSSLKENHRSKEKEFKEKGDKFEEEYKRKKDNLERDYQKKNEICKLTTQAYEDKAKMLTDSIQHKAPFSHSASMLADFHELLTDDARHWLLRKKRPMKAGGTTDTVLQKLKSDNKTLEKQYKEMQYKYECLLEIFPDLHSYLDDEDGLMSAAEQAVYEDSPADTDRVIYFLKKEEYLKLSVTERNQLALDRYVAGRKRSAREAGYDYEMCCAYRLRQMGFRVDLHGIKHGLEDLGRDLIADNGSEIWVVQCKRYKEEKKVHENTVCQLFGTTHHYIRNLIETPNLFGPTPVYPVLITTGMVSETAAEFASILKVRVLNWPMEDYPRIKCNINGADKIYHLPFDQQYNSTQINKPGEFYALTVAEAEAKGFRRAMRHHFQA